MAEARQYYENVVLSHDGNDCLIWPFSKSRSGYAKFKYGGRYRYVHRMTCEDANGPAPTAKHEAAHACGRRACVAKRHLSWKTTAENAADRLVHGTDNRGAKHGLSKLAEQDIRKIRDLKGGELSMREIGALFGIGRSQVCRIQNRQTWDWLP